MKLSIDKIIELDVAYTHAGVFHADDVFSAALLMHVNPNIKIVRTFNPPSSKDDLVFDIGGGEFDHHGEQEYRPIHDELVPYAAFGKLWREIGLEVCEGYKSACQSVEENLVSEIDWSDCCGQKVHPNLLSVAIASFNPTFEQLANDDKDKLRDDLFITAVVFAGLILKNFIKSAISKEKSLESLKTKEVRNHVLLLDEYMPWKDYATTHNFNVGEDTEDAIWFACYPSLRQGFNIESIPSLEDKSRYACDIPNEYWGKQNNELPEGLSFVHASGFLSAAIDKETALKYANEWVSNKTK